MKTNRRTLLMGAAALGLAAPFIRPGAARAAEFTMKLANNQPMTHPTNVRAAEAVARRLRREVPVASVMAALPPQPLVAEPSAARRMAACTRL